MPAFNTYSAEELRTIQTLELTILEKFITVCNEHSIDYFLVGGTALGAIRHGGFIPWDDDIDVGMTRANYEKFLRIAPQSLPSNFYLQTPYTDKHSPYCYSKIRINGTKFVEYPNRNLKTHHGVYLDIFPFDEVPDDEVKNRKHYSKVQKLVLLYVYRQSPDLSQPPKSAKNYIRAIVRRFVHICCKLIPRDWILSTLDKTLTMYNNTGNQAISCLYCPKRNSAYLQYDELYPLIDHAFENLTARIPNKCDIYLSNQYGDYKKLPPESERYGHKPYYIELPSVHSIVNR